MSNRSRSRVFITGASGFIGSALAVRLAGREDLQVTGLVRNPRKGEVIARAGVEVVEGDITDHERMNVLLERGCDTVVHIAAWLSGFPRRNFRRVNVKATQNLIETSIANGVERFIFTSSIMVYGLHESIDVFESSILEPFGDDYGDTKIQAERVIVNAGVNGAIETCIVRPGMVYGPGSVSWTLRMIDWAKLGILPLVNEGGGSAFPIYIDNLVDLLELCVNHSGAANAVFNAVDDGPISFREFLGTYMAMIPTTRALRVSGETAKLIARLAEPFAWGRSLQYIANQLIQTGQIKNDNAKTILNWRPAMSLRDGMARTAEWLRNTGRI